MANIRKSFNLRSGVQVDEDNLLVNSLGNVGLGTTVPSETLDVRGNIKSVGVVTAIGGFISGGLESVGVSTFSNDVLIGSGITAYSAVGVVSATSFRGDGSQLTNIPTSQWTDYDPGLGYTSIYNEGFVGIATTNPSFTLQIGGNSDLTNFRNGVGINSSGNMVVTGIVTSGSFKGEGSDITDLNANNIKSGIVSNAYLQAGYEFLGILTASQFKGNVLGDVVGFATTARDLVDGLDLSFGSFTSDNAQIGILTVTGLLIAPNDPIGVGTTAPQANIHVKKAGISSIQISSDTDRSIITLSRGVDQQGNASEIRFANSLGSFPNSDSMTLDFINYSVGSINSYLHAGAPGIGTGQFNWFLGKNTSQLMTLTSEGQLGIGRTIPDNTLDVVGTSTVRSNSFVGGNFNVVGNTKIEGNIVVDGTYNLTSTDIAGLNLDVSSGHSNIKNLNIDGDLRVGAASTLGETEMDKLNVGYPYGGAGGKRFALNSDSTNSVAIGTDRPINDVGLIALDVRHGKATFSGIGVGITAIIAPVDFRNAGRSHADVSISPLDANRMYMYPPKATNTERGNFAGLTGGAMFYNSDANALQVYNGSSWTSLGSGGGGGEANQNAFSNIAVAGQSNIAADSSTDTLTLVGGANVTITTNAGNDSVTIAAGGGGSSTFTGLSDTPNSFTSRKYLRVNSAGNALEFKNSGLGDGFVNAADYGLDASATTGSTNVDAINAAISALGTNGGTIFFPGGMFYLNATITLGGSNNSIRFVGSGHQNFGGGGDSGGTVLRRDQDDEFFNITNSRAIHFVGITFKGGTASSSGGNDGVSGGTGAITVTANAGCQGHLYENLVFYGIKNCLNFIGLSDSIIRGCRFRHPPTDKGTGSFITLSSNPVNMDPTADPQPAGHERLDQIRISDCVGDGYLGSGANQFNNQVDGIFIRGFSNTIFVTNTSMIRLNRSYYTDGTWSGEFLYFQNVEAERASGSAGFFFNSNTSYTDKGNFITLDNCFSSTNQVHGIELSTSLDASVNITNCNVRGNKGHGILIDSQGGNTSIVNPIVCGNNADNSGGDHGIVIGSGINDVYIAGGRCGGNTSMTGNGNQAYGIRINDAAHNNIRIIGTNCTGNATGGIDASLSGTGNKIQFNAGSALSVNS